MPTFVKTGFWEKTERNLRGWLNLDRLIEKKIEESGGGTIPNDSIEEAKLAPAVREKLHTIVSITQEAYDALDPKVSTTLYLIPEE